MKKLVITIIVIFVVVSIWSGLEQLKRTGHNPDLYQTIQVTQPIK